MGTRRQIDNDERCKPMQSNAADIRCPNCASVIEVHAPIETSRWWSGFRDEVLVTCSRCEWECTVDSNAEISDDGEAAVEWELELDAEGELVDAREDLSLFTKAEIRQLEFDKREWSGSEDDDDYQIQWARNARTCIRHLPQLQRTIQRGLARRDSLPIVRMAVPCRSGCARR